MSEAQITIRLTSLKLYARLKIVVLPKIFSNRGSTVEGEQMGKLTVLPMDIVLFVAFVAYCLFFKKRELGLIGTFVFVYYLGFIFAKNPFIALGGESSSWVYIYGVGGLGLICLFLVGFANKQSAPSEPQAEVKEQTEPQPELQSQV